MTLSSPLALGLYFCACVLAAHSDILTENIYALRDPIDKDVNWLIVVTSQNDTDDGQVQFDCEVLQNSQDLSSSQLMARQRGEISMVLLESMKSTNFATVTDFLRYFTGYMEVHPTVPSLRAIVDDCNNFSAKRKTGTVIHNVQNAPVAEILAWNEPVPGFNYKFQGTKWCGSRVAKNFDDLGVNKATDECCRTHTYCEDTMGPGETKYNITNYSLFSAYSCLCDHSFFYCLVGVNTDESTALGMTYFTDMKRPCFYEDYPVTAVCKRYQTFLRLTCLEYERDNTAEKVYQWRFAPPYETK